MFGVQYEAMQCLVVQCRHGSVVEIVAFRAEVLHFIDVNRGQLSICIVIAAFRIAVDEVELVPLHRRNPVLKVGQCITSFNDPV